MKKFLLLAVVFFAALLSACNDNGNAEKVAEKIENNGNLTQEDYGVMLDYITPQLKEIVRLLEMGADEKDIVALNKQYPLSEKFLPVIMRSEINFDEANKAKAEEIGKLYLEAYKAAAKKQGVNIEEFNSELPNNLPEVSEHEEFEGVSSSDDL